MQKAAVEEETVSCLGDSRQVQRAVLQPSKAGGIQAGSCNRNMDLSRESTARASLPVGIPISSPCSLLFYPGFPSRPMAVRLLK